MLKWFVTLLIVLAILAVATPALGRLGIGRLPGDFRIPVRGRLYSLPLSSTLIACGLMWLVSKLL